MKAVKFLTLKAAMDESARVATQKGCGKNPGDITKYWYNNLDELLYVEDSYTPPAGAVELKNPALQAYESAKRAEKEPK